MAVQTSADGVIKSGANAIAEVTSFSFEQTSDTTEDTVIGDTDRSYKATLKSFTATIEGFYDPADTSGQETLSVGSEISFSIYPQGEGSGDVEITGSGMITGKTVTNSVGEMVTASFSVQGNGALTYGTVS